MILTISAFETIFHFSAHIVNAKETHHRQESPLGLDTVSALCCPATATGPGLGGSS